MDVGDIGGPLDNDATFDETDLSANLPGFVPAGLYDGGDDVLGADVRFAQSFLPHHAFLNMPLD